MPEVVQSRETLRHVLRFDRVDRALHGFLMLSFLGLASTGMPLLFSDATWAGLLARALGGFTVTHVLHRVFATIMIVVFLGHAGRLVRRVAVRKDYSIFWGPTSMVPQPRDLTEMLQHVRWFLGYGQRPVFDRYTYWEKFDYWAVFWGMAIIGGSGLMLWFPEVFARVLPGWVFNIALLIHGEEALLAVGFIFTIHFFNTHLRPEKFPMDLVIFTGRMPVEELKRDKPGEYERLVASGKLEEKLAEAYQPVVERAVRLFAWTALTIGSLTVLWIVWAM